MDKVPRGVGVFDVLGLGLGDGSRAGAFDSRPLSSPGMMEKIKQFDSVNDFLPDVR